MITTIKPWTLTLWESVWWVFSQLWQRDLIYRGTKVVPFSTALGTVLSNFEASSNYQDVQDPSVIILFKLRDDTRYMAVWTTTPWTLPANMGLCVGADISYVAVTDNDMGVTYFVAEPRVEAVTKGRNVVVGEAVPGTDLVGKTYEPLFDYYEEAAAEGAFQILAADFVSTGDGTGVVHAAPAFGEDDYNTLRAQGIWFAHVQLMIMDVLPQKYQITLVSILKMRIR